MNGYIPVIIKSCDELLKTGGFDYAFCGGNAIDIHFNGKIREHGAIDVCSFEQDRDFLIPPKYSVKFL